MRAVTVVLIVNIILVSCEEALKNLSIFAKHNVTTDMTPLQGKVQALEDQVAKLRLNLSTIEAENAALYNGSHAIVNHSGAAPQANIVRPDERDRPMNDDEIVATLQTHSDFNAKGSKSGGLKLVAIVATDSNPTFEHLIANWACNLHRVNMSPLVWALDQATHTKIKHQLIGNTRIGSIYSSRLLLLQNPEVQALWSSSTNNVKTPGKSAYMAAVAFKPLVMYEVVRLGFDLLYLDVDVGLAQDPRPWIIDRNKRSASDIQISVNYPQEDMVNSGVVFAPTSHAGTHTLLESWSSLMQAHECRGWDCGDQEMLQHIISNDCRGWKKVTNGGVMVRRYSL